MLSPWIRLQCSRRLSCQSTCHRDSARDAKQNEHFINQSHPGGVPDRHGRVCDRSVGEVERAWQLSTGGLGSRRRASCKSGACSKQQLQFHNISLRPHPPHLPHSPTMICDVCSAMLENDGRAVPLNTELVHHRSEDSLARSAIGDCAICRSVRKEMVREHGV
jgi:hypothetical protein